MPDEVTPIDITANPFSERIGLRRVNSYPAIAEFIR